MPGHGMYFIPSREHPYFWTQWMVAEARLPTWAFQAPAFSRSWHEPDSITFSPNGKVVSTPRTLMV